MEGLPEPGKEPVSRTTLEDQLRTMILSNVTMEDGAQQRSKTAPQRGRQHGAVRQTEAPNSRGNNHGHPPNPSFAQRNKPYQASTDSISQDRPLVGNRDRGRGRGRSGNLWSPAREPRNNFHANSPQNLDYHHQPGQGFRRLPQQGHPPPFEMFVAQCQHLDQLASVHIPDSQMSPEEMAAKDMFRDRLESICQSAVAEYKPEQRLKVQLQSFGSFSSGFATKGSDMDLSMALSTTGATSQVVEIAPPLLRILEKVLLSHGLGARLLTRTRVPILKICEAPTTELHTALMEERKKWEGLPETEKYSSAPLVSTTQNSKTTVEVTAEVKPQSQAPTSDLKAEQRSEHIATLPAETTTSPPTPPVKQAQKSDKQWLREKKQGPLDFSKHGLGIQSDINFANDLALHNTHLLRCYCLCDPRVQPMVLFVKAWAKQRKINSSYSGTLSSYGFVLMVLHFLANVASPPVVPNLQLSWRPPAHGSWAASLAQPHFVNGYDIRYWNDEAAIKLAAQSGSITTNNEPLGALLRNFFQYYASTGVCFGIGRGFQWTQDVLSLRTQGGIVRKQAKGWTGAKTTTVGTQEVRNRYLFAIEDPFETDHNVARTVTHFGVVAIRDEFRRAWRIVNAVKEGAVVEDLFAAVEEGQKAVNGAPQKEGQSTKGAVEG